MKKQSHKRKPKSDQVKKAELQTWVRPNKTAAKYWTFLIGQIQNVVKGTGQNAIVRVRFQYRIDGSRLTKDEFMDFPSKRLIMVKDFAARIKKANPPPIPTPADEYEIVPPPLVEPEPGPIVVPPRKTLKLSGRKVALDIVPEGATPEEAAEIVASNQEQLSVDQAQSSLDAEDEANIKEVSQPIEVPREATPQAPRGDFLDERKNLLRQRFKSLADLGSLTTSNVKVEDKSTP